MRHWIPLNHLISHPAKAPHMAPFSNATFEFCNAATDPLIVVLDTIRGLVVVADHYLVGVVFVVALVVFVVHVAVGQNKYPVT